MAEAGARAAAMAAAESVPHRQIDPALGASIDPALGAYFDACATTPPSAGVLAAMAEAQASAWANPSSLHGFGLAAAESLERSRQRLASCLGDPEAELLFTSGASEAIHLALLGSARALPAGRLLISAVEHPATLAAAAQLEARGWTVGQLPVDRRGLLRLEALAELLAPPTRLVSLIWGQSEVGALQDLQAAAALCRQAGVPLHLDAVQVVGHRCREIGALGWDLLTCTAHKLQGPRGIGLLLRRHHHPLAPLIGGSQEGGRRGGTEAVVLAAGFAQALAEAAGRLERHGGQDPIEPLRDRLLAELLALPGVELSGPAPALFEPRLPHHISLLVRDQRGRPLAGRELVRRLWREGVAAGSGSACRSGGASGASPVLLAMGYGEAEAAGGLRLSLGPWHTAADLAPVAGALERARQGMEGIA
ncbi:MAG: cysteine desulfurase family protein [Cyanobium sp.]